MARKLSWYDRGFQEAQDGLPADPPMHPGHASHTNYSEGYADGERQLERDAYRASHPEDDED
jgi:hypothetical protein